MLMNGAVLDITLVLAEKLHKGGLIVAEMGTGFGKSTYIAVLLSYFFAKPGVLHLQPYQVLTDANSSRKN